MRGPGRKQHMPCLRMASFLPASPYRHQPQKQRNKRHPNTHRASFISTGAGIQPYTGLASLGIASSNTKSTTQLSCVALCVPGSSQRRFQPPLLNFSSVVAQGSRTSAWELQPDFRDLTGLCVCAWLWLCLFGIFLREQQLGRQLFLQPFVSKDAIRGLPPPPQGTQLHKLSSLTSRLAITVSTRAWKAVS